jgi:hypothetical protein
MADKELKTLIQQLHATKPATLAQAPALLSRAKLALLHLNALLPTDASSAEHLALARETLELGAFLSIRLRDTDAFTRYFQQLQPFYALPAPKSKTSARGGAAQHGNESKVTGLYLLLLLSVGDYAGFHTLLEGLESSEEGKEAVEKDEFVRYPVRLEQALMEGSYDKVWSEMKSERVPSEEFAIFSEVSLVYPSIHPSDNYILTRRLLTILPTGPHHHDPLRNRLVLGARLPVPAHRQRQEPAVPRLRGRRGAVCAGARLAGQGRPHLLPRARGRGAGGGQGRHERQRHGYREHAGLCEEVGDDCMRVL